MKMNRIYKLIIPALLIVPSAAWPKSDLDKYHSEITELSIDENLQSPQIPSKHVIRAQAAMSALGTRFSRQGLNTDLSERDGLVLMVTVPAAALFNANDTMLSNAAPLQLKHLAHPLRVPDKYKLLIAVHSDDTGSEDYLANLTRARADAIRQWIADQGIPVDGVVPYGVGYDEPVSVDVSRKGRAANRRVEFYFVPGPVMLDELKAGRR